MLKLTLATHTHLGILEHGAGSLEAPVCELRIARWGVVLPGSSSTMLRDMPLPPYAPPQRAVMEPDRCRPALRGAVTGVEPRADMGVPSAEARERAPSEIWLRGVLKGGTRCRVWGEEKGGQEVRGEGVCGPASSMCKCVSNREAR